MRISTKQLAVGTFLCAGLLSANGTPLTPEMALRRALPSATAQMHRAPAADLTLAHTVYANAFSPAAYVFNQEKGEGFLIVSADDCAVPLLGYSENGSFDPSNVPDGLQYMLSCYAEEISSSQGTPLRVAPQRESRAEVAPLLKTLWNQDAPYNNDTPRIAGKATYTGCVATSTSQVMNYHQWPAVGSGSNSVTCNSQTYTVNFAEHPFDWANMLDTYTSSATAAQNAAVANLMYCVGVGVNMSYGTSDSGALPAAIPIALTSYFDYDKGCHLEYRIFDGLNEWENVIYGELASGRPVVYNGQSLEGGHSFVCDGYQGDGYYHINWGWGGLSNGYFLLSALDPDSQGIGGSASGFNANQSAVIGMRKPQAGSDYVYTIALLGTLATQQQSIQLGQNMTLTAGGEENTGFFNYSGRTIPSVQWGVEVKGEDGTSTYLNGPKDSNLENYSGYSAYSVKVPRTIEDGTYTLRPAWSADGENWNYVRINMGSPQYITMKVEGQNVSFYTVSAAESLDVAVTSMSDLYTNSMAEVNLSLQNTSADEFYGGIMMVLCEPGTYQSVFSGNVEYIDIMGNQTATMKYITKVTAQAGEYTMYFCTADGLLLTEGQTVTVNSLPANTQFGVENLTLAGNSQNADKSNLQFSFDVVCDSGYFADQLTLVIFPGNGGNSLATASTDYLFLSGGQTVPISMTMDFAQGVAGETYLAAVYYGENNVTDKYLTFTLQGDDSGVEGIWSGNTGAEYFTIDGMKTEKPEGGLYLRVVKENGSVKTEKIIVK